MGMPSIEYRIAGSQRQAHKGAAREGWLCCARGRGRQASRLLGVCRTPVRRKTIRRRPRPRLTNQPRLVADFSRGAVEVLNGTTPRSRTASAALYLSILPTYLPREDPGVKVTRVAHQVADEISDEITIDVTVECAASLQLEQPGAVAANA